MGTVAVMRLSERVAPLADRVESARVGAASREVHDERTATMLGLALGVTFGTCLLTGIYSHLLQQPPSWFTVPTGPAGLFRVTQGVHVMCGLASVPLLLAKLYAVSPQLWRRPPVRGPLDAMERLGLLPLVGGSLFLLVTGAANIAHWYPWRFFFPVGHWWAAWLVVGAAMIHVALKAPTIRTVLRQRGNEGHDGTSPDDELTRRGLLLATAGAAALLTLVTAGQTLPFLRRTTLLAPRRPDIGPQGIPVNRTAEAAGTTSLGRDPGYRLVVSGAGGAGRTFALDDLAALPEHTAELPIACVEGWSASARWSGVRVTDVLAAAGLEPADLTVRSGQRGGLYASSELTGAVAAGPDCLLALRINGAPLHPDHGAPVRLIAPNRPGVLQTKWVTGLEVT